MSPDLFHPPNAFRFKSGGGGGGGGGGSQAAAIASAPVPLPAPPATRTSADVIRAESEVAKENLMKKSIKKTIFAGDTGGYKPAALSGDPLAATKRFL